VVTNHEAKNFRLMECPLEKTGMENWNELVAHREDTLLEGLELFEHFIVLEERTLGLTQLRIRDQRTGHEHYLNFGEETYSAGTGTNPEYETEILRFGYTSMTTPGSVYDYHMVTHEKTLMKQQEVVGGYHPDEYQAERRWAKSSDGTLVPMSIVYRKDQKCATAEGNPLLLYGYGSYGHSMDAYFSATRLSLLDRGFVFVLAHIRGGEDLGRKWYEEGRLMNKKNTFLDFIACAEFLLEEQYTSTKHLFAMGGSAGGLLMGAVVNMRPELWKGIVAQVPFVDVVTTMMDDSIPLTTGEFDEWGNPSEEEYYHYIKSYSPYDNIESKAYPNMLITTGLHDSQVQYWEPAKWVARLRDRKTDQNLLLLQTNMDAGHGGASGRFEQYRETALEYAFMLMLVEELKGTRG
jgi:oligopeptidase B